MATQESALGRYLNSLDAPLDERREECRVGPLEVQLGLRSLPHRLPVDGFPPD
jgi:hypothetical protein